MRYCLAKAQRFRLFKNFSFEPHPQLTFITGDNAAGKSSVLEALYVAARGESHRSATSSLPLDGHSTFLVEVLTDLGDDLPKERVKVEWQNRRTCIQINDQPSGLSDLVRRMPVLMLDPYAHQLVEEGPGVRRRFIDWGVFHMEPTFHSIWRRFQRALIQRNSALRAGASEREIESWTSELSLTATLLTEQRRSWLKRLLEIVPAFWSELIDEARWSLALLQGWRDDETYTEALVRTLDGDRAAGYTREGPHRAELRILSDNSLLKERISRGQQKMLIAGLMLGQAELYRRCRQDTPVLLIDDFSAELSVQYQERLLSQLVAWPGQSVVTALSYNPALRDVAHHAMFHVEHGEIKLKKMT